MSDEKKEEKLKDLMNKISIALKDATLQQGFEIICKRIAELEKENKISEEIIIGEQQEINDLKKETKRLSAVDEMNELLLKQQISLKKEVHNLKRENEKLKKEIENMRNSVKEVLLSEDCEVGQILNCVGLTWYDKGTVENIKKENEELKKDKEYLDGKNNEQTVVIIGLVEKLNKISEWVKEQENPDGCIDCDSSATDKLKDILKQN